jgi:hypothetical protein
MADTLKDKRMERERKTVEAMVHLFCIGHHGDRTGSCNECSDLYEYALSRLKMCPFQSEKPTCARCSVHCYRPDRREQIRAVMRYSGPRMLIHHPLLAMHHMLLGRKRR